MAERPVFIPIPHEPELVKEVRFTIAWNAGFALVQKQRNIAALHAAAAIAGYARLLEYRQSPGRSLGGTSALST